ncbi:hypothetical protein JCM10212_006106 [Sporobolomyces blumeae]
MQVDAPTGDERNRPEGDEDQDERQPWELTRAGKRIAELKEVEDNIAVLLHFAGCALASLHPDPLSSFTSREISTEGDHNPPGSDPVDVNGTQDKDKAQAFARYADAYYTTLNDVQVGLRTSIRHLRVARTSPAPLLDPSLGALGGSTGPHPARVGAGGVALGEVLEPVAAFGNAGTDRRTSAGNGNGNGDGNGRCGTGQLSVAAREFESEAWDELARALGR